MADIGVAKLSNVEEHHRLDAEFYKPKYLELDSVLKRINCYKLVSLSKEIRCGPFGSTVLCETYIPNGIPLIRPFNLQNMRIDGEIVYITKEDITQKDLGTYKNEDIFFSRVGDIRSGLVYGFDDEVTISPNIIAVRVNKSKINPYYLIAFLNTYYGFMQIEKGLKIVAQPTIETDAVRNILIPLLDDDTQFYAENTIKSAFCVYGRSKSLYSQAENLLLEELGLKDFKPRYDLFYTANLSKAFGVHRIDAEYFQPCYDEVVKKIIECPYGYTQLSNCVENIKPNFDPTKYPDKTFSYVELADIDASIGIIQSASKVKGEEAPSRARRILKENDVIVSSVEGSLEKVALVDEEYEGSLASTGFFQFRTTKIFPEVLLILSKSIVLQAQLKKECGGTILTAVPKGSIKRLIIPNIPPEIQQKIASLVQQSHESRKKAKQLLESAKRKVEEAIEKECL